MRKTLFTYPRFSQSPSPRAARPSLRTVGPTPTTFLRMAQTDTPKAFQHRPRPRPMEPAGYILNLHLDGGLHRDLPVKIRATRSRFTENLTSFSSFFFSVANESMNLGGPGTLSERRTDPTESGFAGTRVGTFKVGLAGNNTSQFSSSQPYDWNEDRRAPPRAFVCGICSPVGAGANESRLSTIRLFRNRRGSANSPNTRAPSRGPDGNTIYFFDIVGAQQERRGSNSSAASRTSGK